MINRGANPFVIGSAGKSHYELFNLDHLYNLPNRKSVYFTTRPFEGFLDPWFYENGVFDGKFEFKIGQGASGTVISGEWFGKKAAFKFVEIGAQMFQVNVKDNLETMEKKLSEMISVQSTVGSKIVTFYGHYR